MPTSDSDHTEPAPSAEFMAKATSELNNLLQIIAGSSSALEKTASGDEHSAEYLEMLRTSVNRAELLGQELAKRSGGTAEKVISRSDMPAFLNKKKPAGKQAAKQGILVVDDEKMALTLIDRLLREAGYDVSVAHSGFEAVDIFRR